MAKDLRDAAALSDDPAFAKFLNLRADALLSDDYYPSDIAWLDLENPKFDVIFAPYETYLDDLLGVKTSYGASVMIRNEAESKKLAIFQKYVPDLQESLPLAPEDLPSKRGKQSPMEVMDGVYRAGDLLHGYQAVADNLPNDPRIHEEKGSKKIFWKNFMDARVNYMILPLARRLMPPDQARWSAAKATSNSSSCTKFRTASAPPTREPRQEKPIFAKPSARSIQASKKRKRTSSANDVRPMADRPWRLPKGKAG